MPREPAMRLPFACTVPGRFSARLPLLLSLWTAAGLAAGGCGGGGGDRAGGPAHRPPATQEGGAQAGPAGPPGSSGPAGPAGTAGSPGAAVPHRGGTIVTGWTAEPRAVNELIVQATNPNQELVFQLFARLLREEPDFERHPPMFTPALARSYEWSADHKTLTLHLRENARWSDGVPVTADDVRWTWQAQVSPEVAWESSYMKDDIADVEAVDPHTVRVRFKRVYAKQMLDVNEGGILPRHVWGQIPFSRWRQSGDWFRQHLVVDGPFMLGSWRRQQELVLVRNPSFYDPDRPRLDRVVMRIIPDQASILAQLDSGEVDFTQAISPQDVPHVTANPRLRVLAFPYRNWIGVAWNGSRQPFSDPDVRRALGMALDRRAIVETIWGKFARVSESPIQL